VDKQTLLRKLEKMLDEAVCDRTWGTIEIDLKDGLPNLLRKTSTEKLQESTGGNTRAPRNLR